MNSETLLKTTRLATLALQLRQQVEAPARQKEFVKALHLKQVGKFEQSVEQEMVPLFEQQIKSAARDLAKQSVPQGDNPDAQAARLAHKIFDPRAWDDDVINHALPPLAVGLVKAALAQLVVVGVRLPKRRPRRKAFCPTGPGGGVDNSCGREVGTLSEMKNGGFTFYHGTSEQAWEQIQKDGMIVGGKGGGGDEWAKEHGWNVYQATVGRRKHSVYMAEEYEHAEIYADRVSEMVGGVPVILKITVPKESIHKVVQDEHDRSGVRFDGAFLLLKRIERVKAQSTGEEFFLYGVIIAKDDSKSIKASTATEWLGEHADDIDLGGVAFTLPGGGTTTLRIATEFPPWLQAEITEHLDETFAQDYWAGVNDTTLGDITQYLRVGLRDGLSIERMAKEIVPQLLEEGRYAKSRAKNIARTESGHALNGARSATMDGLIKEMTGEDLPVQKTWLSVLGTTTREAHADLDGVPADDEGGWALNGVWCRWPSDISLPPGDRCQCQCTVSYAFGMTDATARGLIEDYNQRLAEGYDEDKAFCPTGPGGGIDNSCGPSSGVGSTVPQPHEFGPDNEIQQSYIDDAKSLYSSEWMRDRGERYKQKMAEQDERLSKVQSSVAGLQHKSENLLAKHDKEAKKLERLIDNKASQEEINAQAEKVDLALDKYFKHKNALNEKAWKEIKKGVVAAGGNQIENVSFETYDLSVSQAVEVGRLQERLSGVVSTRLQQRIDETKIRSIPDNEKQRPYFKGERHGGSDKSIYLSKLSSESIVAHELGHSLESNANVHAMATGFLYTRVANEIPKHMGSGYDPWEMGRDDDFSKAFGNARYVGKHYKSDDTEVISMGLEKLVSDPVYFAQRDPEYFKLVVAVLDGSVL